MINRLRVKRIGKHKLPLPSQHHHGDAGFDLRSTKTIIIADGGQHLIPTGFAIEIPFGFVGIIKDRSSMAKSRMYVGAGVIDSTYRGEVHVMIRTDGGAGKINIGDKIAQLVIMPCFIGESIEVLNLNETKRGEGGFGSTGK